VSVLVTAGIGSGAVVKMQATASDGKVFNQTYLVNVADSPWFQGEVAPAMGAYSVSIP
jgi:carbonic anhydrase/acetyltransferase-like protein (isoleucine patch superfamily)